jgi:hypothetical protein
MASRVTLTPDLPNGAGPKNAKFGVSAAFKRPSAKAADPTAACLMNVRRFMLIMPSSINYAFNLIFTQIHYSDSWYFNQQKVAAVSSPKILGQSITVSCSLMLSFIYCRLFVDIIIFLSYHPNSRRD